MAQVALRTWTRAARLLLPTLLAAIATLVLTSTTATAAAAAAAAAATAGAAESDEIYILLEDASLFPCRGGA